MAQVFGKSIAYVQVDNRYGARGIVRSESRQVLGSPLALEYAWDRVEDSKRPNTSFIERINLRKRACCSLLRRRNPAPARKPEKVEAEQLYRIITPMLFVQGAKSQNCDLDVLRRSLARVGAPTTLHVVDEADHQFKVAKKSGRTHEEVLTECLTVLETWFDKVVNG